LFVSKYYRESLITFSLISTIYLLYFVMFGYDQLINNLERFRWLNYSINSLFLGLVKNFTGTMISAVLSDIAIVFFVGVCLYKIFTNIKYRYEKIILVIIVFLLLFGYVFRGFVEVRFNVLFYLFAYVFFGWGLLSLKLTSIYKKGGIVLGLIIIFVLSMIASIVSLLPSGLSIATTATAISTVVSDGDIVYGLVTEAPPKAYVLQSEYLKDPKLLPVDLVSNNRDFFKTWKGVLLNESYDRNLLNITNVKNKIKELPVDNYIYVRGFQNRSVDDPNEVIWQSFLQSCRNIKYYSGTAVNKKDRFMSFYLLSDCK